MSAESIFRFPAEWEPHEATWLTWPHNLETWPQNLLEAQSEFELFARTLAEVEKVNILAHGNSVMDLRRKFQDTSTIEVVSIPTNDSWIRDYGPTFIRHRENGSLAGIDWVYDGWGKKYPPYDDDQRVGEEILKRIRVPKVPSKLILEGGALDSDGQSTLLTTRSCLSRRNPNLVETEIISELAQKTGMPKVVLLDVKDIEGDDTDGHVDQAARFVQANRVVVSAQQLPFVREQLQRNYLDPVVLPDPKRQTHSGRVLPNRYTNFYIANEIVIVPQFDDANDDRASAILRDQFSDRRIVPLRSGHLAVGLGSFHCLSQQQPSISQP